MVQEVLSSNEEDRKSEPSEPMVQEILSSNEEDRKSEPSEPMVLEESQEPTISDQTMDMKVDSMKDLEAESMGADIDVSKGIEPEDDTPLNATEVQEELEMTQRPREERKRAAKRSRSRGRRSFSSDDLGDKRAARCLRNLQSAIDSGSVHQLLVSLAASRHISGLEGNSVVAAAELMLRNATEEGHGRRKGSTSQVSDDGLTPRELRRQKRQRSFVDTAHNADTEMWGSKHRRDQSSSLQDSGRSTEVEEDETPMSQSTSESTHEAPEALGSTSDGSTAACPRDPLTRRIWEQHLGFQPTHAEATEADNRRAEALSILGNPEQRMAQFRRWVSLQSAIVAQASGKSNKLRLGPGKERRNQLNRDSLVDDMINLCRKCFKGDLVKEPNFEFGRFTVVDKEGQTTWLAEGDGVGAAQDEGGLTVEAFAEFFSAIQNCYAVEGLEVFRSDGDEGLSPLFDDELPEEPARRNKVDHFESPVLFSLIDYIANRC